MHISDNFCLPFFEASYAIQVWFFKDARFPFKQKYGIYTPEFMHLVTCTFYGAHSKRWFLNKLLPMGVFEHVGIKTQGKLSEVCQKSDHSFQNLTTSSYNSDIKSWFLADPIGPFRIVHEKAWSQSPEKFQMIITFNAKTWWYLCIFLKNVFE